MPKRWEDVAAQYVENKSRVTIAEAMLTDSAPFLATLFGEGPPPQQEGEIADYGDTEEKWNVAKTTMGIILDS